MKDEMIEIVTPSNGSNRVRRPKSVMIGGVQSKFDRTDMVKINDMISQSQPEEMDKSAADEAAYIESMQNALGWSYGRLYHPDGSKISLSNYRHLHKNTSDQKMLLMYKNWSIES